ncbi:hypothetical protein [Dorea acetigenes]
MISVGYRVKSLRGTSS